MTPFSLHLPSSLSPLPLSNSLITLSLSFSPYHFVSLSGATRRGAIDFKSDARPVPRLRCLLYLLLILLPRRFQSVLSLRRNRPSMGCRNSSESAPPSGDRHFDSKKLWWFFAATCMMYRVWRGCTASRPGKNGRVFCAPSLYHVSIYFSKTSPCANCAFKMFPIIIFGKWASVMLSKRKICLRIFSKNIRILLKYIIFIKYYM